jgi:hypothetical protein
MIVYDAGALIAADRSERAVWARHKALLEADVEPDTTAPVAAQASRDGSRHAQLHRFLRGCEVVAFSARDAHEVGGLLRQAGTADVVDDHVVLVAVQRRATEVRTSDPDDLAALAAHVDSTLRILPP